MAIGTPVLLKERTIDSTSQASIGLALTAGASAGDTVVVVGGYGLGSSPTMSCADNSGGGNVYALDVRADKTTNNTPHSFIFSTVLAGALTTSHTITVSFGTNVNYPLAAAFKITGLATSSILDQFNSGTGASTSPSSGNITTTQNDEILIGVTCAHGQSLTFGSDWTQMGAYLINTTKRLSSGYSIKSATGTYVMDGSITSADWATCVASYKAPGATEHTAAVVLPLTVTIGTAATASTPGEAVDNPADTTSTIMSYYYQ